MLRPDGGASEGAPMLDFLGDGNAAAIVGVLSGLLLGLASRLGRFCTLGAIEEYL